MEKMNGVLTSGTRLLDSITFNFNEATQRSFVNSSKVAFMSD